MDINIHYPTYTWYDASESEITCLIKKLHYIRISVQCDSNNLDKSVELIKSELGKHISTESARLSQITFLGKSASFAYVVPGKALESKIRDSASEYRASRKQYDVMCRSDESGNLYRFSDGAQVKCGLVAADKYFSAVLGGPPENLTLYSLKELL